MLDKPEIQAETTSLWKRVDARAVQTDADGQGVWLSLSERLDLSKQKPLASKDVEVSKQERRGEEQYVLHNPTAGTYLQLDARGHFIWELLDGTHSTADICVAYLSEFGAVPFEKIAQMLAQLRANRMLAAKPVNVFGVMTEKLSQKRWLGRIVRMFASIAKARVEFNADGYFSWVYKHGGWLLFSRPAKLSYAALCTAGVVLFLREFLLGRFRIFETGGSLGLGLVTLFALNIGILILHEHGHGLAVKSHSRKVISGGFMLYFLSPVMFIDTTDMWMSTKKGRLAVSWAGPCTGLLVASVCSVAVAVAPASAMAPFLFQVAVVGMLNLISNLNPLMEWDGYYILMNLVGIPRLRARSLAFIKGPFWRKLVRGDWRLSREEILYAIFGTFAGAWTFVAVFLAVRVLQGHLLGLFKSLWTSGRVGPRIAVVAIGALILILIALRIGPRLLQVVRHAGRILARTGKA